MILSCAFSVSAEAIVAASGVRVYSDSLSLTDQSGEIRFEGHVRVELEGTKVECDSLLLQTSGEEPPEVVGGNATGNVVLARGKDRATADQASFDLRKGTVTLSGSPHLERGGATISAERIIYRLDEGTADFQGQVRAEFVAGEE